MKSFILCILFSVFTIFSINAASSYQRGYIVDNKNDTIRGFLKLESNLASSQKCILKDSISQNERIYSASDISMYRFLNGKYYVSKTLTINDKPQNVFMEYLVKGVVDIYYYSDIQEGRYFVDKGDGVLIELKNTKYTVYEDNKTFQRNKNEYVVVLGQIFQESPKTCEELMRSVLDYKSLTKLVVDYHKDRCTSEQCVVYKKKTNADKIHLGLLMGLNRVALTEGKANDREEAFRGVQFNSVIYPSVGCFVTTKIPYINNDLFFFHYDASVWLEKHSGTTFSHTDNSETTNYMKDSKFNLKNTLLIKYDLSREKCCPFIEIGIFAKIALQSKFEHTRSTHQINSTHVYSENYTGKSPFLRTEAGPVGGVGLKYKIDEKKELFIDLRFNWGTGVVSDQHFKSNLFSLNLGLQLF